MTYDEYGRGFVSGDELCDLLYANPTLNIKHFAVVASDTVLYNESVRVLHAEMDYLTPYRKSSLPVDEFDVDQQSNWHMPLSYKELDIAEWVLAKCKHDYELQRVGQELLMFQERELFNLLRYLKYLVDTLREHNIVWGVGRGSSTASYVLYLIGIHKIDAIFYDLPIEEFLK